MTAQMGLTETVQEFIDQSPDHQGRTVAELKRTREGRALIDKIMMGMKEAGVLRIILKPKEIEN